MLHRRTKGNARRRSGRLGFPAGKNVVLYAPTWRDNPFHAAGAYRFELRLDLERAKSDSATIMSILIRGHHHMLTTGQAAIRPGFVLDVTRYPDIADLFLVSEVL